MTHHDDNYSLPELDKHHSRHEQNHIPLLENEVLFKLFLQHTPAAVAMFDTEMRYIALTDRWCVDYGLTEQGDIIGRTHYEIFPDVPDRWKAIHQRCLQGATEKNDADPFHRDDGSTVWIQWEIHPWYQSETEIGGIIMFTQVITEQVEMQQALADANEHLEKQVSERTIELTKTAKTLQQQVADNDEAIAQLRQNKALLNSVITNFPGAIGLYDKDLRFIHIDGSVLSEIELSAQEMTGKTIHQALDESITTLIEEPFKAVFTGHRKSVEVPFSNHTFLVQTYPVYADDGTIEVGLVTALNMHDLRVAQQILREREAQLYAMAANFPNGAVGLFDHDLRYLVVDGLSLGELGMRGSDLENRTIYEVFPQDVIEQLEPLYRSALAGKRQSAKVEFAGRPFQATTGPAHDNDGKIIGGVFISQDLTERKKADALLHQSEVRAHTLINNLPGGLVHVVDKDFRYVYNGGEGMRQLGLTNEALVGKRIHDVLDPETAAIMESQYQRVLKGETVRFEGDFGGHSFLLTAAPLRNVEGEIDQILVLSIDITERKRVENALHESEARYRSLAHHLPDMAVVLLDQDLRYIVADGTLLEVFGYFPDQIAGKSIREMMPAEEVNNLEPVLRAAFDGKETFFERENEGKFFEVTITPIQEVTGQILAIMIVVRDVTKQKRAENELRLLLDLTTEVIHGSDFETSVKLVQQRLCEFVGGTHSEAWLPDDEHQLLRYFTSEVVDVEDEKVRPLIDSFSKTNYTYGEGVFGQAWALKSVIQLWEDSSGSWQSAKIKGAKLSQTSFAYQGPRRELFKGMGIRSLVFMPIVADEEVVLVMVFASRQPYPADDQTLELLAGAGTLIATALKRRQMQDALEDRSRALERSNQELNQFAYVASHDLQEPLRVITNYLQLLERRYSNQLDESADKYISRSVEAATRMRDLIQDLLQYSRVQSRGEAFRETNLEEVIDQVLQNLEATIDEVGATVSHDHLPTLMADRRQMNQILQNLLSNAIKFSGDRQPQIHIGVKRKEKKKQWMISVKDNGIGIETEYFDRIFEIFQRLHSRRHYSGTGIGLAICRKIVERHGGEMWVESEPGQGSTFYFTIPDHEKETGDLRSECPKERKTW